MRTKIKGSARATRVGPKGAKRFPNVGKFLNYALAMQKSYTKELDHKKDEVHIISNHASKGLEFPVVIMIGCCDRFAPLYKAQCMESKEEERRVFYVGITRAMNRLYLSTIDGVYGGFRVAPTRYLKEMGLEITDKHLRNYTDDNETTIQ